MKDFRKIILDLEPKTTIRIEDVNEDAPIFAKKDGVLWGMAIQENNKWAIKTGGCVTANGWQPTLRECLESCVKFGYEFYTK